MRFMLWLLIIITTVPAAEPPTVDVTQIPTTVEDEGPDLSKPVPLADPYGLGERLTLIAWLRDEGIVPPDEAELVELRRLWWSTQPPSLVLQDLHDDMGPAELRLHLDLVHRQLAKVRNRNDDLEREVLKRSELVDANRRLARDNERLRADALAAIDERDTLIAQVVRLEQVNDELAALARTATSRQHEPQTPVAAAPPVAPMSSPAPTAPPTYSAPGATAPGVSASASTELPIMVVAVGLLIAGLAIGVVGTVVVMPRQQVEQVPPAPPASPVTSATEADPLRFAPATTATADDPADASGGRRIPLDPAGAISDSDADPSSDQ